MTTPTANPPDEQDHLSRWPAAIALVAVGGLNFALPEKLSLGPNWLLAVFITVLIIPLAITRRIGRHDLNQFFGFLSTGLETLALIASVALLVSALLKGDVKPVPLLEGAAYLWVTNVLVFALWYWRLDAGGPHIRDARAGHKDGAILFPQMTIDESSPLYEANWSPHFVDYLFVAFNNSTAFSPTDAPVLSRWAKLLTMIQSLISLTIVALLAARAVNIIG